MNDTIYTRENPGDFAEKMEKHIPVLSVDGSTVTVKVGAEAHPMDEAHFIEWIALFQNGAEIARQDLAAGDQPEAAFENIEDTEDLEVRAHCNLHGTWSSN
jgi:superoxide reductase